MDQQLDERLRILEKKIDDTYKLVSQMRRVQRNANLMKLAYWGIIILLGFAAMYFIKPYISMLGDVYGGFGGGDESSGTKSLIDQYKELQAL